MLGSTFTPWTRGGTGSIGIGFGRTLAQFRANYAQTALQGGLELADELRTGVAALRLPAGPITVEGSREFGTTSLNGAFDDVRVDRVTLRWFGRSGWFAVGAVAEGPANARRIHSEVNGSLQLGRYIGLEASSEFADTDLERKSNIGWFGARIQPVNGVAVILGAQYDGNAPVGSRVRTGIGIRRTAVLPLPLPRASVVDGIVFEDTNGNGRRDRGEAGVAGVELKLGYLRTTTDDAGRFAFRHSAEAGSELSVNVTTLDPALTLTSTARLPVTGHVDVPVVRQSALQVRVVFVVSGQAGVETVAANGARLLLKDNQGRERELIVGEDGVANATGLLPGRYQITVTRLPRYRVELPKPIQLDVKGGEIVSTVIRVVIPQRLILDRDRKPLVDPGR